MNNPRSQLCCPACGHAMNVPSVICWNEWKADFTNRRLWISDRQILVESSEFDLVMLLLAANGNMVSRRDLMNSMYAGKRFPGSDQVLDVWIARIRSELAVNGFPCAISTIWGKGFRCETGEAMTAIARRGAGEKREQKIFYKSARNR